MPGGGQPVDMPAHRFLTLETTGKARSRATWTVGTAVIDIAAGHENGRARRTAYKRGDIERQVSLEVDREKVGARFRAVNVESGGSQCHVADRGCCGAAILPRRAAGAAILFRSRPQ